MTARLLNSLRVALFVAIIVLIHHQHQRHLSSIIPTADWSDVMPVIRAEFRDAAAVQPVNPLNSADRVTAADGTLLGYITRTSPDADHVIGFSGPTDVLLIFDSDRRLRTAKVLNSRDTREHVQQVLNDPRFLKSLTGHTAAELMDDVRPDAVTGATLTSMAILESIRLKLSRGNAEDDEFSPTESLRFPEPPRQQDLRLLYPNADHAERLPQSSHQWNVLDDNGSICGRLLRSSPAADNTVGYQGPTDTLIAVDSDGLVTGVAIGVSYDNESYVDYVRADDYFRRLFDGRSMESLSQLDPAAEGIEGVSGATMTSVAVAQGIRIAARALVNEQLQRQQPTLASSNTEPEWPEVFTVRNLSTAGITLFGILLGLTRLRGRRRLRLLFQVLLIVWLGMINGDMVSQALLLGWTQNGIPWKNAAGLALLTGAAVLVPITTGHNVYCSHLCPHGAVQQLLRNRLPWRLRLSSGVQRTLKMIPLLLICWVLAVGLLHLPFSAVDIEPFDAWLWTIAGLPAIAIAVIGLSGSLFVPMAYCRFGCPTGALLGFLRNTRSARLQVRDLAAIMLLIVVIGFMAIRPDTSHRESTGDDHRVGSSIRILNPP